MSNAVEQLKDIENNYEVTHVKMKDIFSDTEFNSRSYVTPLDVMNLAKDVKANGLHSPIILMPIDDVPGKKYRIVAGHRRHKAFLVNQSETIPAFIREGLTMLDARLINLTENISRKDLTLYEEAEALDEIFKEGLSQQDAAEKLGASRGWIQVRFMYHKLPEDIRNELKTHNMVQQAIRDLITIQKRGGSKDEMYELIREYKKAKENGKEGASKVRSKNIKNGKNVTKRARRPAEIFELQDIIRDTFGNGLTTRCLAWAGGSINDTDMYETLKEYCEKLGRTLKINEDKNVLGV